MSDKTQIGCKEAFEQNYNGKYGEREFAAFNGIFYLLPVGGEYEHEMQQAINCDLIAFQKGWQAALATMGDASTRKDEEHLGKTSLLPGAERIRTSPASPSEIMDNRGFEEWAKKQIGLNIPDAYAAWNAALATREPVSVAVGAEAIAKEESYRAKAIACAQSWGLQYVI